MNDGPLIFLHITKTAGGTLKSALEGTDRINARFAYGKPAIESLREEPLQDVQVIYGHFMFGLHRKLDLPSRYACFLRHPVSRTISHYHHLRNVERGPVGDKIRQSTDINDFFARHQHWEFSNLMARVISGVGPARDIADDLVLELAVEHIEQHFVFVGFQEMFPLSIRRLDRILGDGLAIRKNINVGAYDLSEISNSTFDAIFEKNRVDLQLYKHCLQRFLD